MNTPSQSALKLALGSLFVRSFGDACELPIVVLLQVTSDDWSLYTADASPDTSYGVWASGKLDGFTVLDDLATRLLQELDSLTY